MPVFDSPAARTLRARMGAFALHASHDARETTAAGRAAFLARFERQVDPDGVLPPDERVRRAEYARRAYFTGLALKRVKSAGTKKAGASHAPAEMMEGRDVGAAILPSD